MLCFIRTRRYAVTRLVTISHRQRCGGEGHGERRSPLFSRKGTRPHPPYYSNRSKRRLAVLSDGMVLFKTLLVWACNFVSVCLSINLMFATNV